MHEILSIGSRTIGVPNGSTLAPQVRRWRGLGAADEKTHHPAETSTPHNAIIDARLENASKRLIKGPKIYFHIGIAFWTSDGGDARLQRHRD